MNAKNHFSVGDVMTINKESLSKDDVEYGQLYEITQVHKGVIGVRLITSAQAGSIHRFFITDGTIGDFINATKLIDEVSGV